MRPFIVSCFLCLVSVTTNAFAQFTVGDRIIRGSLAVGFDSEMTPNFGFDTFRLRENTLRIHFDDTSVSEGFAANDWRILANGAGSGGENFLAIEDSTGGTIPFKVEAGTPNNSLLVAEGGDVGIGTGTPIAPLHIVPTGIFDEARIFVENDKANIAFRELLRLSNNGGVQFTFANTSLNESWKFSTDTINRFTITRDGSGGPEFSIFQDGRVIMGGGSAINFDLKADGDLEISGALSEMSDVNSKENFQDIDAQNVLNKLSELPIKTWNYKKDDDHVRHVGPTAQDFHETFELGSDPTKIASMDRAGVALVSVQALSQQMQTIKEKQNEIDKLNQTVVELNDRLAKIEKLLEHVQQ